jgi:hypothetical protein
MNILQPETKIPMPSIEQWDTGDIPEKTMRQVMHFCLLAGSGILEEAEAEAKTRTSKKTLALKCRELAKYYGQSVAEFDKDAIRITPFGAGLADAVSPAVQQFKDVFEGVLNSLPDSRELKEVQALVGAEAPPVKKRFSLW